MCQKSAKTAKYNSLENFRLYGSTLHNNKQYTVCKTQTGCSHAYVDHRYVFTIYSTVEELGGLMGHMVIIEVTENGSLFQVCINDSLKTELRNTLCYCDCLYASIR